MNSIICVDCGEVIDETLQIASPVKSYGVPAGFVCEKCNLVRKNRGKIAKLRQDFYLDQDNSCKWTYLGLIDYGEGEVLGSSYDLDHESDTDDLVLGTCDVCGKNPLRYNYILKYIGTEKIEQISHFESDVSPYGVVGSECIQYLDHVDMLKLQRDKKAMEEKHKKENTEVFGTYMKMFLEKHSDLWNISWLYFNKEKNLGGSVRFISGKCLEGQPLNEKTFAKELLKALKEKGFEVPDMRIMKKELHWTPAKKEKEKDGPTYEDFRADEESIARAERAFETEANTNFYASGDMTDLEKGIDDMNSEYNEVQTSDIPDGMALDFLYGTVPMTGERGIVDVLLVDATTRKEIVPDRESYSDDWDPVVEYIDRYDYNPFTEEYEPAGITHIHLKKLRSKTPQAKETPASEYDPVLKAIKMLAGDDPDMAQVRNDIGFSKYDVEFGHSLASQESLSPKQKEYALKLVRKYHRQIPSELWKQIFGDEKQ